MIQRIKSLVQNEGVKAVSSFAGRGPVGDRGLSMPPGTVEKADPGRLSLCGHTQSERSHELSAEIIKSVLYLIPRKQPAPVG